MHLVAAKVLFSFDTELMDESREVEGSGGFHAVGEAGVDG
jgi:hypothetical protein